MFGVVGAAFVGNGIVVANGKAYELLFYDRSGRFRRAVGRQGAGPGEFQRLDWIQDVGDAVVVNDRRLGRVSEFTANGDFVRSTNVTPTPGYVSAVAMGVFPDRTILVLASRKMNAAQDAPIRYRDTVAVLRYDRDGQYLDSIGVAVGPDMYAERWGRVGQIYLELPLGRKLAIAVRGWHYYLTNDAASAIGMYDTTGAMVRELPPGGLPPTGPFPDEALARVRDRIARSFPPNVDVGGIADRLPIEPMGPPIGWAGARQLATFRVDRRSNLWLLEFGGPEPEPPVWTVFRSGGSRRGRVTAEEELNVLDADDELVLVQRWDRHDAETVDAGA